ncbi:MAG TPA: hypothetical protein VMU53_12960 [Candidatus Sulfotelmatobacter sp.]|nr:hypothetical protein [Candidatus Sulfotelmatobacter sp.]
MKYVWSTVNISAVLLALCGGYFSLEPGRLRHTNPNAIACAAVLAVSTMFTVGYVNYSIHRWKRDRLSRPSWDRNPFNWWFDPLQSLFISSCVMAASAIGSGLRRPTFGTAAFWTFGLYACFAMGLIVGQIVVYRLYRTHIVP